MSYNRLPSVTRAAITGRAPAGSGLTLLARILGHDGRPITRASLSAIAWTISELTTGTPVATGTHSIADVVFDDLQQNDPRWFQDSADNPGLDGRWGYNFASVLSAGNFALTTLAEPEELASQRRYQIDTLFTPVSGQPWRLIAVIETTRVFG